MFAKCDIVSTSHVSHWFTNQVARVTYQSQKTAALLDRPTAAKEPNYGHESACSHHHIGRQAVATVSKEGVKLTRVDFGPHPYPQDGQAGELHTRIQLVNKWCVTKIN